MADFQEIPLENAETAAPQEEVPEEIQETTEVAEEIPEEIQPVPKKRGRPAGAKNKPKPKPKAAHVKSKAKPAAKRKQEVHYEDYSSEEEEYVPRRRSVHDSYYEQQPVYDSRAIASEVLSILQHQRHSAQNARRNQYAQWVAQM